MPQMTNEEALALQEDIMRTSLAVMKLKRVDYSGHVDPFANLRMSEFIGVEPWRGVMVRLMDKLSRIRRVMEQGEAQVKDESLEDTFIDVINYTCILAGLCKEVANEQAVRQEVPEGE